MKRVFCLSLCFAASLAAASSCLAQSTDRAKAKASSKNAVKAPNTMVVELTSGECTGLGGKVRPVSTSECSKTSQTCVRVNPEGVIYTSCIDEIRGAD